MKRIRISGEILGYALRTLIGTAMYAVAITVFLTPCEISPGGVTGLATVISSLTGLPTGVLTLALNIPIFIWGFYRLGGKFIVKTVISTAVMSAWIDLFTAILPVYSQDRLLAALYGGFIGGVGLATVFLGGASTGGTDIAAKIISAKRPDFSIGNMVLMLDIIVIVFAAVAYRSFETALYTSLTILILSRAIDRIVYGTDKGKLAFIVTDRPDVMKNALYQSVQRGVTVINASGGYSGESRAVLMCAVRINEAARLHKVAKDCDRSAFIIMTEAGEISGEGFMRKY